MPKILRVFALCLVSWLFVIADAYAEYSFTASIGLREEYNDNIFLTAKDKESDFITTIYPAITLTYKKEPITLSLNYGLEFRFYADHSEENLTSISNAQRANFDTTLNVYRDIFFIKIYDNYQRVPIDDRDKVALDNYIVNMTDSNTLIVNPYVIYPLTPKTKLQVGYTYTNQWYKDDAADSYQQHEARVSLSQELSQLITATLSYSYRRLLYTDTQDFQDYDDQRVTFGLTYQVTPRLLLEGMIGKTWFAFDDFGDFDDPLWNVGARYQATDRIAVGARYYQDFPQSVSQGVYRTKGATGYLNYEGVVPSTFTIYTNTNTYVDRRDEYTGARVDFTLPILPKLTGHLRGFYEDYEYSPDGEQGDRYGVGLSFAYDFRITTVTLGYVYNRNNSSIPQNDYDNNIVWLQARFAYQR